MISRYSDNLDVGMGQYAIAAKPEMTACIDIVIVNWNSGSLLRECISSIACAGTSRLRIDRVVVVDNASTDGSAHDVNGSGLPLTTIFNGENEGFSAACNRGARGSRADILLFLNPDVYLFPNTLAESLDYMGARKRKCWNRWRSTYRCLWCLRTHLCPRAEPMADYRSDRGAGPDTPTAVSTAFHARMGPFEHSSRRSGNGSVSHDSLRNLRGHQWFRRTLFSLFRRRGPMFAYATSRVASGSLCRGTSTALRWSLYRCGQGHASVSVFT